jgi:cytochrome c-type biogenesis protein CcmH/NrfG
VLKKASRSAARMSRVISPALVVIGCAALVGCDSTARTMSNVLNTGDVITYSTRAQREGVKLYDAGQYDQAVGAFRNATNQNPRDYLSFYYLGKIYAQQNREQLASQAFQTSLRVQQETEAGRTDTEARTRTAEAFAQFLALAGSRETELASFEQGVQKRNTATDWFALALINTQTQDADNAIDAYNRATLLAPKDQAIAKSYGQYLANLGARERALPVLRKAYQLDPKDAQVNAALRDLGIVPGPSLLTQDQMAKPIMPKGPLPEIEVNVRDSSR